ncbi:hypothetical protein [Oxynema aestuarii]|uniref:Uncharacterized protein n=1 Tax=Oxynema aestuarii AP17 TaxID=2064643 RepID=A0A6H1TYC7_9CYAN|nr:hypothetical protein [Oxynema aestuarii]QIZ71618.1 hypothetical protein HCG48_14330 [Oxynema aestuarii AP17]
MFANVLDRLGNWNPQLFRELKGRLNRRYVYSTIAISAILQFLIVAVNSDYECVSRFDVGASGCREGYWSIEWTTIVQAIAWIFPIALISIGVYQLVADFTKEESRGTLNFIRLSPRSSQTILNGKLLGVPSLIYFGTLLAFPLFFVAAIGGGVPLTWVGGFTMLMGAGCYLIYTSALLNTLLAQTPYLAIASSFLGLWLGSFYINAILSFFDFRKLTYRQLDWQWFSFDLGHRPLLAFLWAIVTVGVANYWVWQALNRRFRNPHGTLLSKKQSYGLVGSFQVWLLGLTWPALAEMGANWIPDLLGFMAVVSTINLVLFLAVIAGISPGRQALFDWARYVKDTGGSLDGGDRPVSKWHELVWGEKSPALVAIALNLAIFAAIWSVAVSMSGVEVTAKLQAIAGLGTSVVLIWIYAAIAQIALLIKSSKAGHWALGTVATAILLPPTLLGLLFGSVATQPHTLWMASVFGSYWLILQEASIASIVSGFVAQLAIALSLHFTLSRQLNRAGVSESKPLLTGK